jgi:hypothetical protein
MKRARTPDATRQMRCIRARDVATSLTARVMYQSLRVVERPIFDVVNQM